MKDVNHTLRNGQYPILKLTRLQPENKLQLTVEPYTGNVSYIAISHIWSEGLGNPVSTTLPYCQLLNIEKALQDILYRRTDCASYPQETLYFWLDTLCIPVQEEHRDLRFAAIRRICATYGNATACLVLDAELQHLPGGTTAIDILIKVITSVWRQRLWTLQESALMNHTYIQGKDCVFDLNRLRRQLNTSINEPGEMTPPCEPIDCELVEALLIRFLRSVRVIPPLEHRVEYTMQRFIAAIANRITSHQGDETIYIANFLNTDPSPLLKEPTANRMRVLLTMLPVIPVSILFAVGPRLDAEGFRWAPRTLLAPFGVEDLILPDKVPLDRLKRDKLVPMPPSFLHPKGLVVYFPSIQLHRPNTPTPALFFVHTPDPDIWMVEAFSPLDQSLRWRYVTPHQHENSAILLSDFENVMVSCNALLVSLSGKPPEGHIVARSIAPLLVSRYDLMTAYARVGEPERRVEGAYVPPRTWCID